MGRRAPMLRLSRMTLPERKNGEQARTFRWLQRPAEGILLPYLYLRNCLTTCTAAFSLTLLNVGWW